MVLACFLNWDPETSECVRGAGGGGDPGRFSFLAEIGRFAFDTSFIVAVEKEV